MKFNINKKIFTIIVLFLSLVFSQKAFSLSKKLEEDLFKRCINDKGNNKEFKKDTKQFCNCYVDKISKEAPDDEKFFVSIKEAWYIQRLRVNRLACMMEISGIKVD
tara:strand:- start:548 stop:865 length:318 start_codon:yes stop_codon:yes gene_type:complete